MKPSNLFLFFFYCCFLLSSGYIAAAEDSGHHHQRRRRRRHHLTKLFVFGDSYADTGNIRKSLANSWRDPYGVTFPGKPTGRFSDGRVLTDYIARFLGLKTPIAYTWMKLAKGTKKLRYGMNFAFGGSGVFDTYSVIPNMTTQINFLQTLINKSVYTKRDLKSSVVVVSLAGNDYAAYLERGGTEEGIINFISLVIDQLSVKLKRLQSLGAKKIVVTGLEPLGCLPRLTFTSSFQQCNETQNLAVTYHNLLLQDAISKLNNHVHAGGGGSSFFILDLYNSFKTIIDQKGESQGNLRFDSPLKPCCMVMSSEYSCGSVNETGAKMYTLCSDPKSSFFWDSSHPTEAGWHAVYINLHSSLKQFIIF